MEEVVGRYVISLKFEKKGKLRKGEKEEEEIQRNIKKMMQVHGVNGETEKR